MDPSTKSQPAAAKLFLPSKRAAAVTAGLGLTALGAALWLRYGIIQNSEIGIACEAAEEGDLGCRLRLGVIMLFVYGVYGSVALIAALIQLWRPNAVMFGVGIVFALLGLVLYNTRLAALAAALLVLSLARPWPAGR
jgi:succinate-acetate transporter protein